MQPSLSVGGGFVSGLLALTERMGVPRDALLACAGLDAGPDAGTEARPDLTQLIALFEAAVELTCRPDLGLEFGRHVRPDTFNALGYALMTCQTLGEAIALVPHYRRLVFDIGYSHMVLETDDEVARLGWHVVSRTLPYCPSLAEALLAGWFTLGRWMAGLERPLKEIRFVHAAACDVAVYEAFFECPVRFRAGENALVFSRALLDQPLLMADATRHLAMRKQARAALDRAFRGPDLARRLRQALIPLMPKCEADIAHAAAAMGYAPRTLQRKLAEESLGFQQVLDAVRQEMACVYLRDPALSALEIALLLGYAEQSSFTRAFRQWLGQTPSVWRRAAPTD